MKKLLLLLISTAITSMAAQTYKPVGDSNSSRIQSSIGVDFGTVADFIIFTGTGAVANTGVSTVTGNVGSNAGAIAGFGFPSVLNGVIENSNAVTSQASLDLAAACIGLQNIPATITDHSGIFGSVDGETIFPGVYGIAAAVAITGTLTLDAQGDPDAIFLFKITGALNSVAGATVLLANGASSDNVFWIAVGAVGLGANTTMIGTAIAYPGAVSLGAGGSMDGRLYATVGAIATNSFEATIPVAVIADTTIPVITLVGDAAISLELGTSYTDAGATASDNIDGVITDNIITVNPVDVNTAGIYTITYNVSDAAGNAAAQVARVVTITALPAYNFLGAYTTNGTPLYLESPGDVLSTETQETISNSLPDGYPVPDYNPQYITSGYDTDIQIEASTDIWVTFVSEGAATANVLGFYTYDVNSPLTTAPAKDDITIIFPNVSNVDGGGGLVIGDKVNIGTFAADTGIGWVLLNDAWSASEENVGDAALDLYSDINFNPETEVALRTHNVLLNDVTNERIVLGFEDSRRDDVTNTQDFNDAVFYITATAYESLNTNNFADITGAYDVSSGNDGGLESNGDLANLIAKRNFKRKKEGKLLNRRERQTGFNKNELGRNANTSSLIDYLPETGMYSTEVATISSPNDLLGITNAIEVFSVDYYQGVNRISAVLATKTEGSIYDHSKVICDRLNNSSLEDIRTVIVREHQVISTKIKRATGEIEYTLSFSIKMNDIENELFSFWNIDQYPSGDYQNFQIWGSSYSQVFSIANYIMDKHISEDGLKSNVVENVIPNVFVKSGAYSNGALELDIVNKTNELEVIFDGNISETEVSNYINVNYNIALSGDYNEVITIDTGVLFDIGFSLQANDADQKDALYLADGPWGLDYLEDYVTINNFNVETSEREYLDDAYEVDRNASASGDVKGNVNLFRHILPGDQTLDVLEYGLLNFKITNNEPVEIIIMQEEDRAWENRIRYTINANTEEKEFNISFNDFIDREGSAVDISNIKTIVYSIIGDYTNYIPFNISIKQLSFRKNSVLAVDNFTSNENTKLMNYPNPFTNSTTIQLPTISQYIQIQVYDIIGRIVDVQKINTNSSSKKVQYNTTQLKKGIYKYRLITDKNKSYFGTFIIN